MVFNEEGDEEFRRALLEDDHENHQKSTTAVPTLDTHLPAIKGSDIVPEKLP